MAENYKILSQEFAEDTELDGKFVSVLYDYTAPSTIAAYSTDAITWTQTALPNDYWGDITYGDGKFVVVGGPYEPSTLGFPAAYSTDAITWTQTTMPANIGWQSVTHGDGKFVAVAYNSTIAAYSTDAITWTQTALPTSDDYRSVIYGSDRFVAVAYNTTAAYSTNGITWAQATLPSSGDWRSVTYGDGKFVAITPAYPLGLAAYSTDGITWAQATMPSASWDSITYGDGKFVATVYGSYPPIGASAYSTDAITWTQVAMPTTGAWTSVTYGEKATNISKTLYTTPASTQTAISYIAITNTGASGSYKVGLIKAEDSATPGISEVQTIIPTRTIDAGVTDEIVGGITLSAGDQIRIFTESPGITAHVYGAEIS